MTPGPGVYEIKSKAVEGKHVIIIYLAFFEKKIKIIIFYW